MTEDEIREIFGADIDEVSLVGSPANQKRIVLMKSTTKKEVEVMPGTENAGEGANAEAKGVDKEKLKQLASLLEEAGKLARALVSDDTGSEMPNDNKSTDDAEKGKKDEREKEELRSKLQSAEEENLKLKGELATAKEEEAEAAKAVEAAHELVIGSDENQEEE